MNDNLEHLIVNVGVPSVLAITAIVYGARSRKLALGWRIALFIVGAVLSIPGLFALYLLLILSSLDGSHL